MGQHSVMQPVWIDLECVRGGVAVCTLGMHAEMYLVTMPPCN